MRFTKKLEKYDIDLGSEEGYPTLVVPNTWLMKLIASLGASQLRPILHTRKKHVHLVFFFLGGGVDSRIDQDKNGLEIYI